MIKFTLLSLTTNNEILLAFLSDSAFDSFELIEGGVLAYLKDEDKIDDIKTILTELQTQFPFEYKNEIVEYQNWNKIWESNFNPVEVDQFCLIRADFHESQSGFEHEIIINPKMAFGTGHHETSFMMLQFMKQMDFFNKNVFDYGAGTGILSIMASYRGAKDILAIDIEEESYLNTIENAERNNVSNIESRQAILSDVEASNQYDIILANINRKVLLDSATSLVDYANEKSILLLSGILRTDIELVQTTFQNAGFQFKEMMFKGEWVSMKFLLGKHKEDDISMISNLL